MTLIYILIGYFVGFLLSLLFLSQFGKKLGCGGYDPPHDSYYDDYDSNASAFFAFSLAWPMFYFVGIIVFLYNGFIEYYKKIVK